MERKKVALVLSGGSALGFAHIGVLKVLEKYGIPIDIVVGTSMGGLIGASYCAGVSVEKMTEMASNFTIKNFFDINFSKGGLFSGSGIMKVIKTFLPDVKIESLDRDFSCVACDLMTEKEYVFSTGSIRDAVRATVSIPGIFVPHVIEDKVLVDGGVINNLPDDIAMERGADVIISVDVLSKCKITTKPKNAIETLIYSINCSTKEIQKYKSHHSDVLIQPNMEGLTQMTYSKSSTLKCIKSGEKEAEKHIDEILKLLKD